ncbi:Ref family recombination enhancement nuclease [Acinetobacter haemolyticus]|uniref:Ref family recombination enhancement nuclease n=1 Tax=Acinetobacter haemolyticus TaxID=29430 RepID=UPI002A69D22C|nr:Ref family recombination enhancement nuclease [Acinetobacter haemolyticus]WPO68765.1 Ref family recombination enhancement nuclease [Acinetobacter haemolyticus]
MRSQKRLNEIRKLPCVVCGRSPVDAAHSNQSNHGKGMGLKACDSKTIPLCRNHHQEFDQFQKMNRSESVEWFDRMLEKTERMLNLDKDDVF